jgi:hypothetical protein
MCFVNSEEKKIDGRRGQSALLLIPPLESFCQDSRDLPLMGQIQDRVFGSSGTADPLQLPQERCIHPSFRHL